MTHFGDTVELWLSVNLMVLVAVTYFIFVSKKKKQTDSTKLYKYIPSIISKSIFTFM